MAGENRGAHMPASASSIDVVKFLFLTVGLVLGLGVSLAAAFRTNIAADWENRRCDPGVIPLAGLFKPDADPRSRAQFATDNWSSCQKEYVQAALRTATAAPQALAAAQADTVDTVDDITSALTDTFVNLWGFCYEAYSTFMEKIHGVGKLFHNQLIAIHAMAGRVNAAITSMVFGLISMIVAFISGIQLVVIIVIIIVGILLVMQILLFFLLLPISSLILTISALVMSIAVVVSTTVAAVTVGEMFQTGACFLAGTPVVMASGETQPIETIRLGDRLKAGGTVTAVHRFWGCDQVFDLHGVKVTGDHLILFHDLSSGTTRRIPVAEHPAARPVGGWLEWLVGPTSNELWCLTTTSRTIPVQPTYAEDLSGGLLFFADWEEIELGDQESLRDWHAEVWRTLNGEYGPAVERPLSMVLASEAALDPASCQVAVQAKGLLGNILRNTDGTPQFHWRPVSQVRPADYIAVNPMMTHFTAVVGTVQVASNQIGTAVTLPGDVPQRVSAGTWVWQSVSSREGSGGVWAPAMSELRTLGITDSLMSASKAIGSVGEPWIHLHTEAGRFLLRGGWRVRDASDVGLSGLERIVKKVVLGPVTSKTTTSTT